jgi:hypothetical protein
MTTPPRLYAVESKLPDGLHELNVAIGLVECNSLRDACVNKGLLAETHDDKRKEPRPGRYAVWELYK